MGLRRAVLTLLLFTAGCADAARMTEATSLKPGPVRKDYSWAEDRYPTQEEFATYGGESSVTATDPSGVFVGDQWTASSTVKYTWVNNASANLSVKVIDTGGQVVNNSADGFDRSMYRPFSGEAKLTATASAAHHQCGITGKSEITAGASLLIINVLENYNPTTLWSNRFTRNGLDASLPACPEKEEATEIYRGGESGEGCGDAEYCSGTGPYPSYPAYSGGGHSPSAMCQLWQFIGYESEDGGRTWEEIYRYYVWYC